MSQVNIYASIEKRSFRAAFMYLLETEYNLLFSRRILNILAEDVEELVAKFYPKTERVSSGQLIWTCTGDDGQKAQPGKPVESYKTTTVVLPLIEPKDMQEQLEPWGYERVRMLLKQKLSVEEISAIIGRGQSVIKEYIAQAQLFHPELFEVENG